MQASVQSIFFDILLHQIDQVGHREKDDTHPAHDRSYPKADRQMRFPNAGRAQEQNVFTMSHEPSRRQFTDLHLIERWLKREVKLIECLDERKARQACFHGHISLHTGTYLYIEDAVQKLYIGPTLFGCFLGQLIQALWHACQLQAFQNRLQVLIAVLVHNTSCNTWS